MLEFLYHIDLPAHARPDGFDHAAVHGGRRRLYVAHTANDALDVIDCATQTYVRSIPDLTGVAGALVSEEHDLVFTSNRGEDTIGIVSPERDEVLAKVAVGVKPNGLAYDPRRRLLLAANVGDPSRPGSFTVSMVDVAQRNVIANVPVAGRTRWTIFDPETDCFYVNIADPPLIAVIEASAPAKVARSFSVPAAGPHGLDLDPTERWLFCACDGKRLIALGPRSGVVIDNIEIAGVPDVVFFNPRRRRLYVAIGDPGVIEVLETTPLRRRHVVTTEPGAHTTAFNPASETIYVFLPHTHRAAVYRDRP
ncbi:MAG: YncE family protein [Candidatus Rokuibacteriota bacterium]